MRFHVFFLVRGFPARHVPNGSVAGVHSDSTWERLSTLFALHITWYVCINRWERRFFTLADDTLTTYKSDRTSEVESVMSLKRCVLRDEGTRIGKSPGRGKVR